MSLAPIAKEMLDIANDLDLVVEEEIHKLPPCDSLVSHPQGAWGHVPEQSASFLLGYPCGKTAMKCEGFVSILQSHYQCLRCDGPGGCGEVHDWDEISFIPLNLREG